MVEWVWILHMLLVNQLYHFAVHLLATDCSVTTNVVVMPYKIVYLDSKLVTATMDGCICNVIRKDYLQLYWSRDGSVKKESNEESRDDYDNFSA